VRLEQTLYGAIFLSLKFLDIEGTNPYLLFVFQHLTANMKRFPENQNIRIHINKIQDIQSLKNNSFFFSSST